MNRDAIAALADFMETCPHTFDMSTTLNYVDPEDGCGTAGCIAGHAALLWPELRTNIGLPDEENRVYYCDVAAFFKKIDVDVMTGEAIVAPCMYKNGVSYLSGLMDKAWAIRMLRHLAKTGNVDWMATKEDKA